MTADSLPVGHLVSIMMLRRLQRTGHKPIVLVGSGTTRIDGPSFRGATHALLDDEQIEKNLGGIQNVFERHFSFGDWGNGRCHIETEWLDHLGYIDFLRNFARAR